MSRIERSASNQLTLIYALIGALCVATIISGVSIFEDALQDALLARDEAHKRESIDGRLEALNDFMRLRAAPALDLRTVAELERLTADGEPSTQPYLDEIAASLRMNGTVPLDAYRELVAAIAAQQAQVRALSGETRRVDETIGIAAFNLAMLALALTAFGLLLSRRIRTILESYRIAKELAESARSTQERFLAVTSHELRTPLHIIIGAAELMTKTATDPAARTHLRRVLTAAETLLSIASDVLDYSKAESGGVSLELKPVRLRELVLQTIDMLRAIAEQKHLVLGAEIAADLPDCAALDTDRVRQVLLNLVGNALKFTEHGGVRLSLSREAAGGAGVEFLRFTVEDTGIGFDEARKREMFEPFTKIAHSTERHFGGTGLGLSISRELVERMGGRIDCARGAGGGAVFWFTVPLRVAAGLASDARGAGAARAAGGGCVLVVDDNQDSREIVAQMVETLGHRVATAENGRHALELLRREPFDLVLIDFQMPEMDGIEATRAIRADEALAEIAVIGVTATALPGEIERGAQAGLDDCIAKPVRFPTLAAAIAPWLGEGGQGERQRTALAAASEPPARAAGVLSPVALQELAILDQDAPGFSTARLEGLLARADDVVAALRVAARHAELAEVARVAHEFKSTCGIVGADDAVEILGEIEAAAVAGDGAAAARGVERLAPELEAVKAAVRAHLAREAPSAA